MEGFIRYLPVSLGAFLASALVCGIVIHFDSFKITAKSDKRRHHKSSVPLLGGMGIIFGSVLCLFTFQPEPSLLLDTKYILCALITAAAFGAVDDIYEIRGRWKFLGQNIIAFFLLASLRNIETPVEKILPTQKLFSLFIEWFWCIGMLNSINLIDGLDGLASGIGMIVISFLCLVSGVSNQEQAYLFTLSLPAILGFYFWNKNPAKIFLGESGAQAIGILLFLTSMCYQSGKTPVVDLLVPLFSVGIPIFDTLMAIARRFHRGVGLMSADREHIHHRLVRLGLSHTNAVRFIHGITIYLCLLGVQFSKENKFQISALALVILGLAINAILLMMAERKLFSHMANFSTHMLKSLDENRQDSFSSQYRINTLQQQGIPYVTYRLNLENSIRAMIEKSPTKILKFYSELSEILRKNSQWELYFQNSTRIILICKISNRDNLEKIDSSLRKELLHAEESMKVDLYLNMKNTLKRMETNYYSVPDKENTAETSLAA